MIIEEGSIFAGRYRLERALARGGMGSVWVAHHMQLDVDLAIKFMDPTQAASPDARTRFEREAKAAAKLTSPHVVQVHDYGVEDGTPYIVMELLVGEDLGDRLKREERLSLKATSDIVSQTAKALRRAHEEKIVHRDLKPGNIFLAKDHDDEIVKVLDFGIAKTKTSAGEATKTGTLIGSPHYMSPEQARNGKNLDHRSDLWSLGVIMFRSLTGHLPFPGDEIGEVIMAICADPIPIPSKLAPHLGPTVDEFFVRALSRDPAKRFQSAREMAETFAAVSAGAPVVVSASIPPPPPAANSEIETKLATVTVATTVSRTKAPTVEQEPTPSPAPAQAASVTRRDPTPTPASPRSGPVTMGQEAVPIEAIPGVPAANRTPLIAAAILVAIAGLGGVGLVMGRASAPKPPLSVPTAVATAPAPPPPTPAPTAALPTAAAETAAPSPSASEAPSAQPHPSSTAKAAHGPPVKKDSNPKPPQQNPLLGF